MELNPTIGRGMNPLRYRPMSNPGHGGLFEAGLTHLVIRFTRDHERHLDSVARIRQDLGW